MSATSSDDDRPLARSNGHKSAPTISRSEAAKMDRPDPKGPNPLAGLSVRNGPVVEDNSMDLDLPTNGTSKRKSRGSLPKISYKDESDSEKEPLAKRPKRQVSDSDSDDKPMNKSRGMKLPPSFKETALPDSSDDDEPLGVHLAKTKAKIEKKAEVEAKAIRAKEKATPRKVKEESDDDEPMIKSSAKKREANGSAAKRKANGVKKYDSDSDVPISKVKKSKAATTSSAKPKTAASKVKSSATTPEVDDANAWWVSREEADPGVKWQTLEHEGVIFPPPYKPWPKNLKVQYDGKPISLAPDAEEVAYFWVQNMHLKDVHDAKFRENFLADFREYVKKFGATDAAGNKLDIKDLDKCDFSKIRDWYDAEAEAKKNKTNEQKKQDKAEKEAREEPFRWCLWDGKKQRRGLIMVEPPGLFKGRGDHPKRGKLKRRVVPEQVVLNIGKEAKVPEPPAGHKWKEIRHDQTITWLASWTENINGQIKYAMLAPDSDVKGKSDFDKFEKARSLKKYIDKIRKDYTKDLSSRVMADRQRATAMFLIDKHALRAGNEKNTEEEADTVGCCSLKYEHITLEPGNKVTFDFLGKDSIRYHQTVAVDEQVWRNLRMFKKPPKTEGDDIFDRLTTSQLNKHLASYMPGLTAKVFRTYNASYTMSELLQELDQKKENAKTVADKVKLYNNCNREVAILCNHKRTVGAAHEKQMQKMGDRIKGVRYQAWRTKMMMIDLDPKIKKKKGAAYFELDEDMDEAWVKEHQQFLVEEARTKAEKKFEKDNEKRKANKERPLPQTELKERLQPIKEMEAMYKKENKTRKVEAEGRGVTMEKLEKKLEALQNKAKTLEVQAEDRDDNKEVALGTSKINYIDPRLTVVFAKKFDVPLERLFPKTLREKFKWAIASVGDDEDWQF